MKPVYWRPKKVSPKTTFLIGLAAVVALVAVEIAPRLVKPRFHEEMLRANRIAGQCRDHVRNVRLAKGLKVNRVFDPTSSGMIGTAMTAITSKPASLEAKQLTVHPHFPAAVVEMLRDAGVERGDTVAIGWTGSFPSLNVALASAVEALELRAVTIGSVTASQYGANEPEFTWLDMESALNEAGLVKCRTMAATIGGPADCGKGMGEESKQFVLAAVERNRVRLLKANRLSKSIDARMRFVKKKAGSRKISAFINVGGGVASCGGEDCVFRSGLNQTGAADAEEIADCMMQRFSDRGLPVVHLAHPRSLAKRYGISSSVETANVTTFYAGASRPSRTAAFLAFVGICLVLQAFVLRDRGDKWLVAIRGWIQNRPALRTVGQPEGPQLMA